MTTKKNKTKQILQAVQVQKIITMKTIVIQLNNHMNKKNPWSLQTLTHHIEKSKQK